MSDVEEAPLPAIFGHCEKVYELMRSQASPVEVEGGVRIIVWEGFLTHLVGEELNMPTPYYTSIRNNLLRMECVRQLQRGGGNSPSQWELVRKPTPELFREKAPKRSQRDRDLETMRGQIADLNARHAKLESHFAKFVDFVNTALKPNATPAQPDEVLSTDHTPEGETLPPSTHNPETGERLITGTNSGHEVVEVTV